MTIVPIVIELRLPSELEAMLAQFEASIDRLQAIANGLALLSTAARAPDPTVAPSAPATPPAPPPHRAPDPARLKPGAWATTERIAYIRANYPNGRLDFDKLAALTGPPLPSRDTIRHYVYETLKLRLNDGLAESRRAAGARAAAADKAAERQENGESWFTAERQRYMTAAIERGETPHQYCPVMRAMPGAPMPADKTVYNRWVKVYGRRVTQVMRERELQERQPDGRPDKTDTPPAPAPRIVAPAVAAQPTEPAAPAEPEGPKPEPRGHWLTEERRVLIRDAMRDGDGPYLWHPKAAKLPGPKMPAAYDANQHMLKLGYRQQPRAKRPAARPDLGPNRLARALELPKEPIDTTTPIRADFATIKHWAAQRGVIMTHRSDLVEVNEKCRSIGHRPFVYSDSP